MVLSSHFVVPGNGAQIVRLGLTGQPEILLALGQFPYIAISGLGVVT